VIVGATIHDFGPVTDSDIVVAGLLPSHLIMPSVDLVVCMGGQGTVQSALASGTPLIGIPLHPEQELNVAVAARQGAGLTIAPRHAKTPAMTSAVRQVLGDANFRTQAQRVRGLYAGVDGAANAAQAIQGCLAAPNALVERQPPTAGGPSGLGAHLAASTTLK
jgi:UDP:flavonoid glycosyltransferase YjiC (YdhE family)